MSTDHFNVSRDETELPNFQQRFERLKPSRYKLTYKIKYIRPSLSPPLSLFLSLSFSLSLSLSPFLRELLQFYRDKFTEYDSEYQDLCKKIETYESIQIEMVPNIASCVLEYMYICL